MKNLKKVLAFVVVFAMMLTSAVSATSFPDVADDASYAEAATILSSLALMIGDEQGNFNPDKVLTRAEATALVMRAKGLESASAGAAGATQFTDVAADHWATGYINLAAQSGVVAGYGDGTFGPEDEVKYEQFVKMLVAALGYTPMAEANGGYPSGYLIVASQKNITKGAPGAAGQPAVRSTVAQLLFNALDVNLMEQTGFVKGEETYEEKEGKTILNTNLGVNKYEGVMNALSTAPVASDDDTTIGIDVVKVDGVATSSDDISGLNIGEAVNAPALLGYYVTAYVGEDEFTGEDVLKAIAAKTGKNDVLTIDYSQITSIQMRDLKEGETEADLDKNEDVEKIFYLENETDKVDEEIDVTGAVAWLYNSAVDTDAALALLEGSEPGVYRFVSNDGQEGYEYVFVTAYEADYLVGEIDAENNMLIDHEGNDIDIIDIESETMSYTFIKDGNVIAFEDIAVGDVLTVAESAKVITVYVASAVVEGKVTEIGSKDGEPTYTIGGEDYKLSAYAEDVKMGDEGKFYLNVDGRIAFAEAVSTTSDNYAWLLAAEATTGIGGDTVEVKFFNTAGEWVVTELASKVNVYADDEDGDYGYTQVQAKDAAEDGEVADFGILTVTAEEVAVGETTKLEKTAEMVEGKEFFQYELNSAGKISKIYTASATRKLGDTDFAADVLRDEATWKASTNRLGTVYLTEATKVFFIDEEKAELADEKAVQIGSISALVDDKEYDVAFYDRDNNGYAAAIVVFNADPGIDGAMHPMVLTKVSEGTNESGEDVLKLYGYQAGEAVTAETVVDTDLEGDTDLNAGDVILFSVDSENKVNEIEVIMAAADAKAAFSTPAVIDGEDADEDAIHYFGLVSKKASGNLVSFANGAPDDIQLKGSNLNYYVVNVNRSTALVNTGSYSDITASTETSRTGSKAATLLFVREYEGEPVVAVAYQMTYSDDVKAAWYEAE